MQNKYMKLFASSFRSNLMEKEEDDYGFAA
jgi:hypothetical protein